MFSALYGVANCRQGVGRHISETQSPCRTQMCTLNNNNPFLSLSPSQQLANAGSCPPGSWLPPEINLSSQGHHGEKTQALVSRYKHLALSPVQNQLLRRPWEQRLGKRLAKKTNLRNESEFVCRLLKTSALEKGQGVPHKRQRLKSEVSPVSENCTKVTCLAEMWVVWSFCTMLSFEDE